MHEKTIKTERIYKGRMLGMREDTVKMATGKISQREICEHPGAVAVIALTDNDEIVLINQYRKPIEKVIYEIPAGLFHKGENLKKAALRELQEETGFIAKNIKLAVSIYTSPGYSTELLHIFLATKLIKGDRNLDEDEHIDVCIMPIKKALKMVKNGKIQDGKTILGIYLAHERC